MGESVRWDGMVVACHPLESDRDTGYGDGGNTVRSVRAARAESPLRRLQCK